MSHSLFNATPWEKGLRGSDSKRNPSSKSQQNPVQKSEVGGERTNDQVIRLPPKVGGPQRQPVVRTAMDTAERYRMAVKNIHMGQRTKQKTKMQRMSLLPHRGTTLGNLGLTEAEIREEVENDTDDLVAELVKLPTRARIQAIRALPMSFQERRNIRSRVISVKLSKRSVLPMCCSDVGEQVSLSFRRCGSSLVSARQRLVIWQDTLKAVGGRFGTSVLSYFRFLKWLLMFNVSSVFINFCFITVPQIVHLPNVTHLTGFRGLELLTGAGYFNQTVFFYGGYNGDVVVTQPSYNMQLAYFFTIAAYFVLCGVYLIFSMARSFQRNFTLISSPAYTAAWRLLCSWDFSIVNEKAIQHLKNNLGIQLKESLAERLQRKAPVSVADMMEQLSLKLLAWLLSVGLALASCAAIYFLGSYQSRLVPSGYTGDLTAEASTLLLPVVVSLINAIVPLIYTLINKMENYASHRTNIYIIILRNVLLKMSILGILCYYWLNDVPQTIPCWESFVGQCVYRLVIVDFLFCLIGSFFGEFLYNVIGTKCIRSLGVPEFDIATNVLDLIYAQTLAWIGIYFSPLLPILQVIKFLIIFYLKRVSLNRNCQPPRHSGRAAQMETVYIALLFVPSFVGALSMVAYTVWSLKPSEGCGPFQGLSTPFQTVLQWMTTVENIPGSHWAWWIFEHVLRNELFYYLITLVILIFTYFLWQVTQGRKQLIRTLQQQIVNDGKDKAFLLNKLQSVQKQRRFATNLRPIVRFRDEADRQDSAAERSADKDPTVRPQTLGRVLVQGRQPPPPLRHPPKPARAQAGQTQIHSQTPTLAGPGGRAGPALAECWLEDESPALDTQPAWPVSTLGSRSQRYPRLDPLPMRHTLLPGVVPETPNPPSRKGGRPHGPHSGAPGLGQPRSRPPHDLD